MPPAAAAQRKRIADSIEDGKEPYAKKQKILFRTGRSTATLRNARGVTAVGRIWESETGQAVPTLGQEDLRQEWVQRGKSEFLVDSSGKRKRLRTWRGQEQGYNYTNLGRAYFTKNKSFSNI